MPTYKKMSSQFKINKFFEFIHNQNYDYRVENCQMYKPRYATNEVYPRCDYCDFDYHSETSIELVLHI